MRLSKLLIPIVMIGLSACSGGGPGPVADSSLIGEWRCDPEGDQAGLVELEDDHTFVLENFSAEKVAKIFPNYDGVENGVIGGTGDWSQSEFQNSGDYVELRFHFEDDVMGGIGNVPVFIGSSEGDALYLLFTEPDFSERIECDRV